jgi:plasmid maintenance system antidote protein VapI
MTSQASQANAAKRLGVSQPNVSNLARGHYEDFSIDLLIRLDSVPSCVGEIGGGVGERESEASLVC